MALPPIDEFTYRGVPGAWRARWSTPLSAQEARSLPEQVDADSFEQLKARCAWQRIRRDLVTQAGWRSKKPEIPFCTGDLR